MQVAGAGMPVQVLLPMHRAVGPPSCLCHGVKPSRGPLTSSCDCSAGVCGPVGTGRPRPPSASSLCVLRPVRWPLGTSLFPPATWEGPAGPTRDETRMLRCCGSCQARVRIATLVISSSRCAARPFASVPHLHWAQCLPPQGVPWMPPSMSQEGPRGCAHFVDEETEIWRWERVQAVGLPCPSVAVGGQGHLFRVVCVALSRASGPTLGSATAPPGLLPLVLRTWRWEGGGE